MEHQIEKRVGRRGAAKVLVLESVDVGGLGQQPIDVVGPGCRVVRLQPRLRPAADRR